jgi:hypothetical protein
MRWVLDFSLLISKTAAKVPPQTLFVSNTTLTRYRILMRVHSQGARQPPIRRLEDAGAKETVNRVPDIRNAEV